MNLDDFLGKHYLTGVEYGTIDKTEEYPYEMCNTVDFILDGKNISVVEDPSDGWRSSMDEILVNRKGFKVNNTFDPVEIVGKYRGQEESYRNDNVIDFVDSISGKVVLSVGTEDHDDWYPCFVGVWRPENLYVNIV